MLCPAGEETDMFRVDMSGFKAKGDVATLIGAPKGYQDSVGPNVTAV
jgi:ATP-dependent Clp protease ATP-binding subunit ClpA|eukprot:COSAG02_NODE_58_length_43613_cov_235.901572_28_plen_47_part_00